MAGIHAVLGSLGRRDASSQRKHQSGNLAVFRALLPLDPLGKPCKLCKSGRIQIQPRHGSSEPASTGTEMPPTTPRRLYMGRQLTVHPARRNDPSSSLPLASSFPPCCPKAGRVDHTCSPLTAPQPSLYSPVRPRPPSTSPLLRLTKPPPPPHP